MPLLREKNGEFLISCRTNSSFETDNWKFKFPLVVSLLQILGLLFFILCECGLLSTCFVHGSLLNPEMTTIKWSLSLVEPFLEIGSREGLSQTNHESR